MLPIQTNMKINERHINNYPVVKKYKYLGMEMDNNCNIMSHAQSVNAKICFLTARFSVLRQRNNLKLNINLFKIFIMPLLRLGFPLYHHAAPPDKEKFLRFVRTKWKIFVGLPITCANRIIVKMMGDIHKIITESQQRNVNKRDRHWGLSKNFPK